VWDAHSHLGPWYKVAYPVHTAEETVRRMDEVGLQRITVSDIRALESDPDGGNARQRHSGVGKRPGWWQRQGRAGLQGICGPRREFAGRIFGYAAYAPHRYADDMAAFEQILDQPGIVGIKIHCDTHKTPPDSPKYRPAYEVANERGLPVLSHGVFAPAQLPQVLREFPNMVYIAAHYGAGAPGWSNKCRLNR